MLRRRTVLAAPLLLPLAGLTGCAAAGDANPEKIGPRGVDELTIPTPSPRIEDFVATVDNPWLPLAPGTVWTYDVSGGSASRLEVNVMDGRSDVVGVRCTMLHAVAKAEGGLPVDEWWQQLAQDTRGNVWLLGEYGQDRSWGAESADTRAGLYMAATPRVGDGYLEEDAPGVAADRTTVLSLTEQVTVPAGTFGDLLLLETRSGEGTPTTTQRWYAQGTGLVESAVLLGGTERVVLRDVATG